MSHVCAKGKRYLQRDRVDELTKSFIFRDGSSRSVEKWRVSVDPVIKPMCRSMPGTRCLGVGTEGSLAGRIFVI